MNKRIRLIREHFKLNQTDFGKTIGLKQSSVASYETGVREPTESVIMVICDKFKVSEIWLRTGEGEMFQKPSDDEEFDRICTEIQLSGDEFIKSIIRAYWKLPENKKAVVRELIDSISDNKKSGGIPSGND